MKRFYAFLMVFFMFFAADAQMVDYELLGFADENGEHTSSIVMNSTQDLKPRVILKNNGPDVVGVADTVFFDIFYNETHYVTSLILMGSQLQQLTAGEYAIIDLNSPIWTAETMDQYSLIACSICYEVGIAGVAIDPYLSNNRACIPVTRDLDIDETATASVRLFPNPAAAYVTISGAEGYHIQLFDLAGKMVSFVNQSAANQGMDVSSLAEGLYIVRISDGQKVITRKLNIVR